MKRKRAAGTMFTSVDIDEDLFMRAWTLSGSKTKKDFLEEALRLYLGLHDQAQVKSLRGKLAWDGDIDDLRERRGADPR